MAFWQSVLLTVIGVLVTALVGTVVADFVTRAAQKRSADRVLREDLAFKMADTAYGLYFPAVHIIRWHNHAQPSVGEIEEARRAFDAVYVKHRVEMGALWTRLKATFGKDAAPSRSWHQLIDRLTVLAFHALRVPDSQLDELIDRVQGPAHAGLAPADLRDPFVIGASIDVALDAALDKVTGAPLTSRP